MNEDLAGEFVSLLLRFHQLGEDVPPFEEYAITPAQVVYIEYLAKHGPCRLKELHEGLAISPASASIMMRLLEKKGLIERESDENDKRSVRLHLSKMGATLHNRIRQHRNKKTGAFLSNLSGQEQEEFLALFRKAFNN